MTLMSSVVITYPGMVLLLCHASALARLAMIRVGNIFGCDITSILSRLTEQPKMDCTAKP
jgi:hypothetical protein